MQPPQRLAFVALWAVSLCVVLGCGSDLAQTIEGFATPTRALESGDPDLVRQLKVIEQSGGLASQLAKPTRQDETNAAFVLAEKHSEAIHLEAEPLLKADADPESRAAFVGTHTQLLDETAGAADLNSCQFDVGHQYGFFARMRYLDDAKQAALLLRLRAAHHGATDQGTAALADLSRSLKVIHWLSQVRRVESRVLAATLRSDTLRQAAELIEEGTLRRFESGQLYGVLRDHLSDWPPDSRMLVGERATVLHSYEAIRAGMLDKLITLDEREQLEEAGHLDRLRAASHAMIDDDESAYLTMMERLVGVADESHAAKQESLGLALSDLSQRPSLFARSLFIDDLPDAIWFASADRAMTEAWTIALATAAQLPVPPFSESPLNGRPYEVESDEQRVTVSYGEASDQRVTLPVMTKR